MSSTKGTSSKITAMLVIVAMLVSAFSIMGMTAEEAHAAAKAKKPAKISGFAAKSSTNQYAKATWKKAAKKVKANKKKYTVNYQLKVTEKNIFGKTKTKNYNIKNAATSKAFYNNPGTKYTFKIRGYYTYKGKKVYGAWSAAKSTTIPANGIRIEGTRTNDGNLIAQATILGAQKYKKYTKLVFSYNGVQKTCAPNGYVIFNDLGAGTLTAHGEYTVNGKTVRTATGSKAYKASVLSGGNGPAQPSPSDPTTGTGGGNSDIGTSPDDINNTNGDITVSNFSFSRIASDQTMSTNGFTVTFDKPIKSKYDWKAVPADNGKLRGTLGLSSDKKGTIKTVDAHTKYNDQYHYEVITNWLCTDIYLEAYKKGTTTKVFSKKMGYETNPGKAVTTPGNCHYGQGNPYYDRCMQLVNYIINESGALKVTGLANRLDKIENYTKTKFFWCLRPEYSMNVKANLGFFENKVADRNGTGGYLDVTYYDYSKILAYLLGVDGGDCIQFTMIENLFVKTLYGNSAKVESVTESGGHTCLNVKVGSEAYDFDCSNTTYRGGLAQYDSKNREAIGLYNNSAWRAYFKGFLGAETASYYGIN